jgi:aldehyde dehydrogenase (NAD+)
MSIGERDPAGVAPDAARERPVIEGEARLLINGVLREARAGRCFPNIDPATEEVLGVTCDADSSDMEAAIQAARNAFDETSWSRDHEFRRHCLEQLRDAMDKRREELRALVVAEAGSPLALTYAIQVEEPIADLDFWAEMTDAYTYETWLADREVFGQMHKRLVLREARGVVGAITPWNYPLYLNIAKLAPALAAGNTVVLKPAPDTPWCATVLGRIIAEETDIPAGVVNVVASSDHSIGEVLTGDPRVDMITFTGSTATGRKIMANASHTVKKVFLELGGKSANIVLDDAEMAEAVGMSAIGVCTHAGQGCAITTRLLLPRSRYEEGIQATASAMASVTVGDPWDPSVLQGPLISARQRERVLGYLEEGIEDGARVVLGGGVPETFEVGYYVEPTLLADVDPTWSVAQEEIFGPVLVAIAYEDDDDAVRIANGTPYGLSGAVMSKSVERATEVAKRLRTGTVSVNGGMWFAPDVPFGGYGQSGIGRENGIQGFEEYLETKVLAFPAR